MRQSEVTNKMAKDKDQDWQKIGTYAFIIGVIIAIIAGLVSFGANEPWVLLALVVLGLLVGILNIKDKDTQGFLLSTIALMLTGSAGLITIDSIIPGLGTALQSILRFIVVFVAPAALIVGLKTIYMIAHKS